MKEALTADQQVKWPRLRGKQSLCTVCMQVFRTVSGFDRHHTGPIGNRRCLDVQQLKQRGWNRSPAGVWRQPGRIPPGAGIDPHEDSYPERYFDPYAAAGESPFGLPGGGTSL